MWRSSASLFRYVHFMSCLSLNPAFKSVKLLFSNKNGLGLCFLPIIFRPRTHAELPWHYYF
jgi:hypothetical protein